MFDSIAYTLYGGATVAPGSTLAVLYDGGRMRFFANGTEIYADDGVGGVLDTSRPIGNDIYFFLTSYYPTEYLEEFVLTYAGQQGPTGSTGPTGDTGDTGPTGDNGLTITPYWFYTGDNEHIDAKYLTYIDPYPDITYPAAIILNNESISGNILYWIQIVSNLFNSGQYIIITISSGEKFRTFHLDNITIGEPTTIFSGIQLSSNNNFNHESESYFDSIQPDYEIINDGTFEDLENKKKEATSEDEIKNLEK